MSSTALVPTSQNVAVSAETPQEMVVAQHSLIEWCKNKIREMQAEAGELEEAFKHAFAQKWKTSTLRKHWNLAVKRVQFYGKMLQALEAGYIIVPNFPVTIFAIRTEKEGPRNDSEIVNNPNWGTRFVQFPQLLPTGQGEYQNPFPVVYQNKYTENQPSGNEVTKYRSYPAHWDEFEFPLNMAKPQVMEATTRAMALKLFDDLGVLPGPKEKADPIIVGRLIDPRSTSKFSPRCVSFMIAWHLDTRVL